MIKIAGTLPVKSRLPLSAWLLAALVTLFSLVMHVGTMSGQPVSVSEQEIQAGQKSEGGSVLSLLAHLADVLTSSG
jgi:hypothetical protein